MNPPQGYTKVNTEKENDNKIDLSRMHADGVLVHFFQCVHVLIVVIQVIFQSP